MSEQEMKFENVDFFERAQRSAKRVFGGSTSPEKLASWFVDDDVPKIDVAVKSYMSLVVARNLTASTLDEANNDLKLSSKDALTCARILLRSINSHEIPKYDKLDIQHKTLITLWNATQKPTSNSKVSLKPTKVFGKRAMQILYKNILAEIERNYRSCLDQSGEGLLHIENTLAFCREFAALLNDKNDMSSLVWSRDHGKTEMAQRHLQRQQQAHERTLGDGAKTPTIEEIGEDD